MDGSSTLCLTFYVFVLDFPSAVVFIIFLQTILLSVNPNFQMKSSMELQYVQIKVTIKDNNPSINTKI